MKKHLSKTKIVIAAVLSLVLIFGIRNFSNVQITCYNIDNIENFYNQYSSVYDKLLEDGQEPHYSRKEFINLKYMEYLKGIKDERIKFNYVSYEGRNPKTSSITISNSQDSTSITHALIHYVQHKDSPLLFNLKYRFYNISKGFWDNPFEREAYLNQFNSIYLTNRPKNAHRNFK